MYFVEEASAHCDIPCGIYDPHLAQIAALTTVRMNQLIGDLSEAPDDAKFARYVAVKEHHAELCKHEIRIIWGDYIKPEHVEQYPELHQIVWNIMKLGSKTKQEVNLEAAQDLLDNVQKFSEIFWQTKASSVNRQPSRQTGGGELVYPAK
tara:strand:+ start:53 stop:502 length:450 start_codon:yes stop_codon:yes gene_type:complete